VSSPGGAGNLALERLNEVGNHLPQKSLFSHFATINDDPVEAFSVQQEAGDRKLYKFYRLLVA